LSKEISQRRKKMKFFKMPTRVLKEIELHDSQYWLNCCLKELNESYIEYLKAKKRYQKAKSSLEGGEK
jgi:hypothetical protein